MTRATALTAALTALLAAAPAAHAGEPIMPLDDVRAGMHCTARSVVHGTEIATFDADVLDVIAGDRAERSPRILVRVSGPAIDATGIGPGFSGSPISCPGADGTPRIAGAISEGVGAYGGTTALATPIEAVLGEPVDPPASARTGPAATRTLARARPLATPLTIGGLSAPVARFAERVARRAGRTLHAAPAAPRGDFAPAPMLPGAAMAVGYATGDITAGGIGTVTYVDGDSVWAFGHSMTASGRRALFLQDAYVYGVIGNPIGSVELSTYKLAAPGHVVGTLSGDGLNAVTGRLGTAPPSFPMQIVAHDLDRGLRQDVGVQFADETDVGLPDGSSALSSIAPFAVIEAAVTSLGSSPPRVTSEMCFRVRIREAKKPMRFCNRYVSTSGEEIAGEGPAMDVALATGILDAFDARRLHIERVHIALKLRRGEHQAFLVKLQGPKKVRRGQTVRLRAQLRHPGGGLSWRTIRVRIPRSAPRGRRDLALIGASGGGSRELMRLLVQLFEGGPSEQPALKSVPELAAVISAIHRFDGVRLALVRPGRRLPSSADPSAGPVALQPKDTLIGGEARMRVRVR